MRLIWLKLYLVPPQISPTKLKQRKNEMQANQQQKCFSLVVAYAKNRGIGFQGGFPWPMISKDLKHFSRVTQMKELGFTMAELTRQRVFY